MPKSARITGMSVLGVKEDGTVDLGSTQAEATLYYHKATADIKFNGMINLRKQVIYLLPEVVVRFTL